MKRLLTLRSVLQHPASRLAGLLLSSGLLAFSTQATTYPVTTTANAGAGSLRPAILDANADASATAANPHVVTCPLPTSSTSSGGKASRCGWLQNGSITIL
ncbi:hypothetical protein IC229_34370 [Spirosoma sp. BT702]|uniref:Uncharacterized protein n=1 Tax=Spirosoma profusum TaxID=2771354 RepID=A0A927GAX4_9BACT|nr:hypothetical protein [Spirosoma profusum]MBD2705743.1 hypothetical protein [Spirosoma profusum]